MSIDLNAIIQCSNVHDVQSCTFLYNNTPKGEIFIYFHLSVIKLIIVMIQRRQFAVCSIISSSKKLT